MAPFYSVVFRWARKLQNVENMKSPIALVKNVSQTYEPRVQTATNMEATALTAGILASVLQHKLSEFLVLGMHQADVYLH